MKLVATPASPYSRKVRIVLAEKQIEHEFIIDSPGNPATRVADYNPLGKIPVMVLDDGMMLFDSRVIVEYLDAISPVGRLIPENPRDRMAVKRWEALADGCTDAATGIVMEKRRAPAIQSAAWLARQKGKIERALLAMSQGLGSKPWCSGDQFNLSDIAVGSALGVLDFRMPDLVPWRKLHPNLSALSEKLAQRESFKATRPYLIPGVSIDFEPGFSFDAQLTKA